MQGDGKRWYNTIMTIKKIKPIKPAAAPAAQVSTGDNAPSAAAPAAPAGATIADRFKLDVPEAKATKGGSVGKTAATIALVVGFAALVLAGVLTFVMYQHWDFLCNQVA